MIGKKGVSEFVAYVFLVIIIIVISVMVYAFLKGYLIKPTVKCSADVELKLASYSCNSRSISLTLRNKGLFDIDGYILKASNSNKPPGLDLGDREGNFFEQPLKPGESYSKSFTHNYGNLTKLEIIPIKIINKDILLCQDARFNINLENCSYS